MKSHLLETPYSEVVAPPTPRYAADQRGAAPPRASCSWSTVMLAPLSTTPTLLPWSRSRIWMYVGTPETIGAAEEPVWVFPSGFVSRGRTIHDLWISDRMIAIQASPDGTLYTYRAGEWDTHSARSPSAVPLARFTARSMLSIGMLASRARWIASRSEKLASVLGPPLRVATIISRVILVKS